jgi:hypothetical protein
MVNNENVLDLFVFKEIFDFVTLEFYVGFKDW